MTADAATASIPAAKAPIPGVAAMPLPSIETRRIPLTQLMASPDQVRKDFAEDELKELAQSIKARGVIEPIVVRPRGDKYEIIAGERRWRASKLAGLADIPATIRTDLKDQDAQVLHLVENLQRTDLSLNERCSGVRALVKQVGVKLAAGELGKSEAWISKHSGVFDLPAPVVKMVGSGQISDLEIAGTLGQLLAVHKDTAEDVMQRIVKPTHWQKPVTRDGIRQELKWAQERVESERKHQAEQARLKASAEKKKESPDKEQLKAKEKERQIARVKDARKVLREESLVTLQKALGVNAKDMDGYNAPVRLDYVLSDFASYGSKNPDSADACNFSFNANADLPMLNRIAAGFAKTPLIRVNVPDLTLEQCARLVNALKDVKEDIDLGFERTVNGRELRAIVGKIAGTKPPAPAPKAAPKKATAKKRK